MQLPHTTAPSGAAAPCYSSLLLPPKQQLCTLNPAFNCFGLCRVMWCLRGCLALPMGSASWCHKHHNPALLALQICSSCTPDALQAPAAFCTICLGISSVHSTTWCSQCRVGRDSELCRLGLLALMDYISAETGAAQCIALIALLLFWPP